MPLPDFFANELKAGDAERPFDEQYIVANRKLSDLGWDGAVHCDRWVKSANGQGKLRERRRAAGHKIEGAPKYKEYIVSLGDRIDLVTGTAGADEEACTTAAELPAPRRAARPHQRGRSVLRSPCHRKSTTGQPDAVVSRVSAPRRPLARPDAGAA